MKKHFFKVIGIFAIGFTLFSCTKEGINETSNLTSSYQNEKNYLSLLQRGISEDNIKVFENYYVVDGDVIIDKEEATIQAIFDSSNTKSLQFDEEQNIVISSSSIDYSFVD